jgi:hypothetical protein
VKLLPEKVHPKELVMPIFELFGKVCSKSDAQNS